MNLLDAICAQLLNMPAAPGRRPMNLILAEPVDRDIDREHGRLKYSGARTRRSTVG